MRCRFAFCALLVATALGNRAGGDEASHAARWDFGAEEFTPLASQGDVQRDQAGPRPPEFPEFAVNNTAVKLDGKGARLVVADSGANSPFDFTNGDEITIEAWVNLEGNVGSSPRYVIGKGRTGSPRFARDNQNWALRVVGDQDVAKLSFLFATQGGGNSPWHRWTSQDGFAAATGWHHIAVAYRFGEPESIRGWIDGQATEGTWDMGGPTREPPIVDDDEVWIGSSLGGNPGNSLRGWLDAVAVHRALLDDDLMAARFRRVGGPRVVRALPPEMPELGELPAGRVLATFHEGMPARDRWLNESEMWPEEVDRWLGGEFLLPRIPLRHDEWGIRASWQAPLLVRLAADVELPPGRHRFLVRARSLSRLWIDGDLIADTPAVTIRPPDGEEPMTPVAKPPLPGLRVAGYHQQEVVGDCVLDDVRGEGQPEFRRVVLEMVLGGDGHRTESGEVCVAVQTHGGKSFQVLRPSGKPELQLTDQEVEAALARIEASLVDHDDRARRRAASTQNAFWRARHDWARKWAGHHPPLPVPTLNDSPGALSVDAFIEEKIARARKAASRQDQAQARHFHTTVLPVLRDNCFRCHGEKDRGGLKLNTRERALLGGDSEAPAIVPGDADASELIARVSMEDEGLRMPPAEDPLSREQIAELAKWIAQGANWPAAPPPDAALNVSPIVADEAFLRRIYLDTVGVPPSAEEAAAFLLETQTDKRERLIDRLLDDERFAEHWMSFWLDLLAENPTLINSSLNSTGPFRWFLYDSLRDNKPLDRMVTELILMRGSPHEGGSAGFALAGENDAPMAAKGHILASAFLGIELQCARCHDSPYHATTQRDLFSLAAMLTRKEISVPPTSRVPDAFFEQKGRESLIRVTMQPGEVVSPNWPFEETAGVTDGSDIDRLMQRPDDSRERLAALITAPQNARFARVMVNRVWKQLIGGGIVEPVHDWEGRAASHSELLDWLTHQLITHDYDMKHLVRLIVTSKTYQREATGRNAEADAESRFFNAPDRRRLTAEQIVDSLHAISGSPIDAEELTFVHDGRRPISSRLTLGLPRRAWMFASLNNERDRPSLSLPRARAVCDVLQAFGWTGSRQKPITVRDTEPNVLQPGVLANGTLTANLSRAAHRSELSDVAVKAESPEGLVVSLFLRFFSRMPKREEAAAFVEMLASGFEQRLVPADEIELPKEPPPLPLVTWFNHLQSEANTIQQEIERRVREGPPPDPRLRTSWREVYEDVVWSLINHREFVWVP